MEKMNELVKIVKEGKWDEAELKWMEILEGEITTLEPLCEAAQELKRRGQQKQAEELLQLTTVACSEVNNPALWTESLKLLSQYRPKNRDIFNDFCKAFKDLHKDRKHISEWIDRVANENSSPNDLIRTLDKLVIFRKGTIVKHRSGWGIGTVTEIGEEKMEIFMDLQRKPGHRMDALAAADCLTVLGPENFEALLVLKPDVLSEMAKEKPLKLMYKLLNFTERPIGARDIKQFLCPDVIPQENWSKWWGKTRKMLITDAYIETAAGAQGKYALREQPRDWDDEVKETFDQVESNEKTIIVLDYIKNESSEKKCLGYFAEQLVHLIHQHIENKEFSSALECYLIAQESKKKGANLPENCPQLADVLGDDITKVFCEMRLASLAQSTLDILTKDKNWESDIVRVFKQGTDLARDTMFKYLKKRKMLNDHVVRICQEILDERLTYPDALLWMTKQIANKRLPNLEPIPKFLEIFQVMLQTATTLKFIRRWNVDKVVKFFTASIASKIADLMEEDNAVEIVNVGESAKWLTDAFHKTLSTTANERFPDLFSKIEPIYTTPEGLAKYEEEYRDLIQNKIPENSKAIGEALSFGDISENAELDAAREVQVQLMTKAKDMQTNINRAKLIDSEAISADEIAIGSTVSLKNEQGEKVVYSILGPWDVSVDRGLISYMSPIGEALLGARCGDEIKLPLGKHGITKIEIYASA